MFDRLHVRRRPAAPGRLGDLVRRYLVAKEASGRSAATVDCYRIRLGRLVTYLGDVPPARIRADDLRGSLLALKRGMARPTSGTYVEGHRFVADGLFELARLTLRDVDLQAAQARIRGKNRRVETVPLSPALVAEFTRYLEQRPPATRATGAALFTSPGGAPVSTNAMRLWMRRMKRTAGLEGKRVSPHVIRASAATHFAASGASAFGVQRFLRHRTLTMSQRYVDLASLDFARLHATASPLQAIARATTPPDEPAIPRLRRRRAGR